MLIDYKDYYGAVELSKYYVNDNGWRVIEVDEEYFVFEGKGDLPDDYRQYFHEVAEYGYSITFNAYRSETDYSQ